MLKKKKIKFKKLQNKYKGTHIEELTHRENEVFKLVFFKLIFLITFIYVLMFYSFWTLKQSKFIIKV